MVQSACHTGLGLDLKNEGERERERERMYQKKKGVYPRYSLIKGDGTKRWPGGKKKKKVQGLLFYTSFMK